MATYDYGVVNNTVIAHKKPITLQQGRALRDNLIASFEGQPGAPRLALAALPRISAGASTRYTLNKFTAATTTVEWRLGIIQGGSIRVRVDANTGAMTTGERLRGGVGTAFTGGGPEYDVTVLPGDMIHVIITDAGGAPDGTVTLKVTAGEDLWPAEGTYGYITGNGAFP